MNNVEMKASILALGVSAEVYGTKSVKISSDAPEAAVKLLRANNYRPHRCSGHIVEYRRLSGPPAIRDAEGKMAEIKEFVSVNGRMPKASMGEAKLVKILERFCSMSSDSFNEEFNEWARANGYGGKSRAYGEASKIRNKLLILSFIETHGHRPRYTSVGEEKRLYFRMSDYIERSCPQFDIEFEAKLRGIK